MKILVTGATGYIGQELVPLISGLNEVDLLLISRDETALQEKFDHLSLQNTKYVSASDWDTIIDFAPEVIVHLAAFNSARDDEQSIEKLLESNVLFGVKLLSKLSDIGSLKFFINTGSFAQYRMNDGVRNDAYFYAATKSAFEVFLEYFSSRFGFKYITAVPFSVYGGNKTVKRVIDFICESLESETPAPMTEGRQILDFVHVKDVAAFYVNAIQAYRDKNPINNGEKYFLGTGCGISIRELSRLIETQVGKTCNIAWGTVPYRDRDIMFAVADLSVNPKSIEWRPYINLQNGLKDV